MNKPKDLTSRLQAALKSLCEALASPRLLAAEDALKFEREKYAHRLKEYETFLQLQEFLNKQRKEIISNQTAELVELKKQCHEMSVELYRLKYPLHPGQKFYNPTDHKAPTVWLCAKWGDWYMIRTTGETVPVIISAVKFEETYNGYVKMPAMNKNRKTII